MAETAVAVASGERSTRWTQVLRHLAAALSPGPRLVVVDGHAHVEGFVDRLAEAIAAAGHDCVRVTGEHASDDVDTAPGAQGIVVVARHQLPPEFAPNAVLIWLRTRSVEARVNAEHLAQIVVDLLDPTWPVVRRLDASLADRDSWYLGETQAFFAVRAAT